MPKTYEGRLLSSEWCVRPCPLAEAQRFIKEHHYAGGGSNTAVFTHGLYSRGSDTLMGVAWWLPPTRVACESVDKENWTRVLSLTRMAIHPEVPKNACSFLLARSVRLIKNSKRFVALVTYADESQGHTGGVYLSAGWSYIGRTGPYPRWLDKEGRQVSVKATKNRTKAEMLLLGHVMSGRYYKHKYVLRLARIERK